MDLTRFAIEKTRTTFVFYLVIAGFGYLSYLGMSRAEDPGFIIRAAQVTEKGGFIALELEGQEDQVTRILDYLNGRGIEVIEGLGEAGSEA